MARDHGFPGIGSRSGRASPSRLREEEEGGAALRGRLVSEGRAKGEEGARWAGFQGLGSFLFFFFSGFFSKNLF